jgi:hypothetical protein
LQLLYLKTKDLVARHLSFARARKRSLENAGDEIGGKAHELLLLLVGGSWRGRRAARRQLRRSCHSWGRAGPGRRQSAHFPAVFRGNVRSNENHLPDTDPLKTLRIRIFSTLLMVPHNL